MIAIQNEITGVQYHPRMEHLFVTSDGSGKVFLRDARMAFGSQRTGGGIVLKVGPLVYYNESSDHTVPISITQSSLREAYKI